MKFYRLRDIPRLPNDVVFRESSRKQSLFFLIFLTLLAGMTFLGSSGGIHGGEFELPSVLAYYIGVVMRRPCPGRPGRAPRQPEGLQLVDSL